MFILQPGQGIGSLPGREIALGLGSVKRAVARSTRRMFVGGSSSADDLKAKYRIYDRNLLETIKVILASGELE